MEEVEDTSDRQAAEGDQTAPAPCEPEPLVLTAPRELEYVFEVSAEEATTRDARDSAEDLDEILLEEEDLTPAEEVEDEAFAYEVRTTSGAGGGTAGSRRNTFAEIDINKQLRAGEEK